MPTPIPYAKIWLVLGLSAVLIALTLWPELDLWVSAQFYTAGEGFAAAKHPLALLIHDIAFWGARILGLALLIGMLSLGVFWRRSALSWLRIGGFLLLALLVGPGLVANTLLKDQFGRARPSQVEQFGGSAPFTPALVITTACDKNCSFVSGDAAFGFYLTAFALVVPMAFRRRVWSAALMTGVLFGANRIAMGGHFLSDVIYAGLAMIAVNLLLWKFWFRKSGEVVENIKT